MSVVNLMGCHHINSAYLCDILDIKIVSLTEFLQCLSVFAFCSVPKRELNSTCLGSLYVEDFPNAINLFETVLQLQDNWYLVHSPRTFTSYIICLNNSNSEAFVKARANHIFVSPSYWKEHILISDFSVWLDASIKHYKWELDEIAFSPEEQTQSSRWLEVLGDKNMGRST
jgi:hypothetical protein